LNLLDGYYGYLSKLEHTSREMQFSKGSGLPGSVWDYRIPMVVSNMLDSSLFQRASTAVVEGITSAIGLPFSYYTGNDYVLSFLSANSTPIALRVEIWVPDREGDYLFFHAGTCEQENNLSSIYKQVHIKRGDGLLGRVWLTGFPMISTDLKKDKLIPKNSTLKLGTGLVMPIIEEGYIKSIVVFLF
jgi:hypothetical protein